MKVAITTQGTNLTDELDLRFGRAKRFLIVDTDSNAVESLDNAVNLNAAQGAGIQSAQAIARAGVGAVITGHVGPKAFAALQAADIEIHLAQAGTAAEALDRFKRGALPRQTAADVESHW